jgi:hypothetical protein
MRAKVERREVCTQEADFGVSALARRPRFAGLMLEALGYAHFTDLRVNLNLQPCLLAFFPLDCPRFAMQIRIEIFHIVVRQGPQARDGGVIVFKLRRCARKGVGKSRMEGELGRGKRGRVEFNGDRPGVSHCPCWSKSPLRAEWQSGKSSLTSDQEDVGSLQSSRKTPG